jgi:UDP-N-acetylmuramoylalanine-D-glutamate ligase
MKKIQFLIALWAAKGSQLTLKLLGRNATYLPGKIAVRICKDFLRHINTPKTVIAVTGTNGKTTVSNLLTSILRENGFSVTNNSFGSNVQAGVISALAEDTTFLGKPKKDIAVLEVDERSSLLIYPDLKPNYMVCNNIMRDSLKRNAHTEFISYIITKALPASTKLVLNADDLICARLGSDANERVFFGLDCEIP